MDEEEEEAPMGCRVGSWLVGFGGAGRGAQMIEGARKARR